MSVFDKSQITLGTKKTKQLTAPLPLHRILREALRHYTEYRQLVNQDGRLHVLDYGYWVHNEDGTRKKKIDISISFWDLHRGLKELAPRKREALWWNVIMDEKQKDVAKRMGITTVSVGQYVEAATLQLMRHVFTQEEIDNNV
jgi:DNA-directed RNA polymerase specialized sigma24 family protein